MSKVPSGPLEPDKPSPKHTVLIHCTEPGCNNTRWVKPQDVFQVKRCRWCQEERKLSKSRPRLAAVRAKVEAKKVLAATVRRICPQKLIGWHIPWPAGFRWPTPAQVAFWASNRNPRRIWA